MDEMNRKLKRRREELGKKPAGIEPVGNWLEDAIANTPSESTFYEPPKRPTAIVERATLGSLRMVHPKLSQAVSGAKIWQKRKREGHENASLILCGPVGTGKTHIARAVLWSIAYAIDGEPVQPLGRFWTANELMVNMQSGPGRLVGNAPLVVIDDVGSEKTLPYISADNQADEIAYRYFELIDYCYSRGVSIVMTSNLTFAELALRIGDRSWSRLQEMAGNDGLVDLTGVPDFREKENVK